MDVTGETKWGAGWVGHLPAWAAVSAVVTLGILAIQPGIAGLFHDDGLYLAVARSLAEGGGYRLGNLPGDPLQTKYPFLTSALLAPIWRLAPPFPDSVILLKGIGVLSLAGVAALCARLYTVHAGAGRGWQAAYVFLACVNVGVLHFVDFTLSDLPFLALCLLALCLGDGEAGAEAVAHPGKAHGRRFVFLGVIVGLALLLRQAALPLLLAGTIVLARSRRWRLLPRFLGAAALVAAPWFVFKWLAPAGASGGLLSYYTAYEPSVPALWLQDGPEHLRIVLWNVYYVAEAFDRALFLPVVPSLRWVVYPIALLGLWKLFARPAGFLHWFAPAYLLLIVLWPFHPWRYAAPLLPIVMLGFILGTREMWIFVGNAADRPAVAWIGRGLAATPLASLLVVSVGWGLQTVGPAERVRIWGGGEASYAWHGFEETFHWVRENTPPDAILATAYDPMYYLYTDRRGIRPWLHRPWTYFYPAGSPPRLGQAANIQAELTGLGVTHLIVDPLDGYAEAPAAGPLYDELLGLYAPPRFDGLPVLRFTSSDSLHFVYELPAPAGPPEGAAPAVPPASLAPGQANGGPDDRGW